MIRILAASGGSKHAQLALRMSCRMAAHGSAELTVLMVDDPHEKTPLSDIQRDARRLAQETDTRITIVHSAGQPDQVIRATALDGYDLLVIGARGLHSMQDFFLGRNAIRLIRNLPLATLVVRKMDSAKHILWRLPEGEADEHHLELMTHVARTLNAELTLLKIKPQAVLFANRRESVEQTGTVVEHDEYLESLCSTLSTNTQQRVTYRIRCGIPEAVILEETAIGIYDLVAVSVRARRGLSKLFSEDLCYRVARNLPVSVLLLNQ